MANFMSTFYRFYEHNEDSEEVQWSVSGGQIEKDIRHYRIYYESSKKYDIELTISTEKNSDDDVRKFVLEIAEIVLQTRMVRPFVNAVKHLCAHDPFLQKSPCKLVD